MEIDERLTFSRHISAICAKAGRQLNALARLSNVLSTKTKITIFNSFILCHFNYCPLVWHHCSKESMNKMEKVQERGLRIVYNDKFSDYADLLSKANKQTLYIERLKRIALLVYKAINNEGPPVLHDLFEKKELNYNLRDSNKINQPLVNTKKFGIHSLRYSGALLWNQLPFDVKNSTDLKTFKNLIKKWDGSSCKCGVCLLCEVS